MEWNGKKFPYFHTFSILAHFNVVFIPNAVNNAAFDQTHKMIKKSSSQIAIQMNRVEKKNENYNQISAILTLAVKHFATSI